MLRTHDRPPTILAAQLFFLFDEKASLAGITDNMSSEMVVVEVGNILHSKQRLHEDVTAWARDLFKQAGLPFEIDSATGSFDHEENPVPLPSLSVVCSQPATSKTVPPSTPQKRKTRRVYLEFAIQLLERGSCTHRDLVDTIMKQFPNLNRETVSTFVSDIQNPKYSPIKDRKVVKQADGTLIFEDKIKPALTVIENPSYAGTGKAETEPVTDIEKQVSSSGGDL
ncbi:MAG: hypothetical protein ABSG91_03235 [Syntrophobacteraceae bacterium]